MKLLSIYSRSILDRTRSQCYSEINPSEMIGNETVGYKTVGYKIRNSRMQIAGLRG
ncbi:MAG: hypothetical protein R3Y58_02400 [Eubacteriales bacterium]